MKLFGHKVRLHLKSGTVIEAYVTTLRKLVAAGDLVELSWTGGKGMPFYLRLSDVSACTSKRVLNWRRCFR